MARQWRAATDLREIVEVVMRDAVRALEHGRDSAGPSWLYPAGRRVAWPIPDRRQVAVFAVHGSDRARRAVALSVFVDVVWTHVRARTPLALYDPWPWHLTLALMTRHPLTPTKVVEGHLRDEEWQFLCRRARELASVKATVIRSCRWRPHPSCPADVIHLGRRPVFYRDIVHSGCLFVAVFDAPLEPAFGRGHACFQAVDGDPVQVVPAGQIKLPGLA